MQQEQKKSEEPQKKDNEQKPFRPQSYHINIRTCGAKPRL